jgi:hypothetical protein
VVFEPYIVHSNIPVNDDETHVSMARYAAGPIFQWVDDEGKKEKQIKKRSKAARKAHDVEKSGRWAYALSLLLSTVAELRASYNV